MTNIEAKYSETSGQYREQWVKEIVAYKKQYGNKKEVSFIALGGNDNYDSEEVEGVTVLKCSWTALLNAAASCGIAKNTITPTTSASSVEQVMPKYAPFFALSYCFAPRFCPMNVVSDIAKQVIGKNANPSIFE